MLGSQTLQEEFNLYRKKDVGQELLVDIYVKGKGERYLPNKMEELYNEDLIIACFIFLFSAIRFIIPLPLLDIPRIRYIFCC